MGVRRPGNAAAGGDGANAPRLPKSGRQRYEAMMAAHGLSPNRNRRTQRGDEKGAAPVALPDRALSYEKALEQQCAALRDRVDAEKTRISALEARNRDAESDVEASRRAMANVDAIGEFNKAKQRHINALENRIEQATLRASQAKSSNQMLRQRVNELRRRRLQVVEQNDNVERSLLAQKRQVAELSGRARVATAEHTTADMELRAMEEQRERDRVAFERQWKELGRVIEEDRMKADAINRELIAMEKKALQKRLAPAVEPPKGGAAKKATRWGVAYDKIHSKVNKDGIRKYTEAFARLRKVSGLDSTEEVVAIFLETEEEISRLMAHAEDLYRDEVRVEHNIEELKKQMKKLKGDESTAESTRQRVLDEFDARRAKAESAIASHTAKLASVAVCVEVIAERVRPLVETLECAELVGADEVKAENLLAFLGAIEQRTMEALQAAAGEANIEDLMKAKRQWRMMNAVRHIAVVPPSVHGSMFATSRDLEAEANIDDGGRVVKTEDLRDIAMQSATRQE